MKKTFHYKAINSNGNTVTGLHEANSQSEVISFLHAKGFFPTSISSNKPVLAGIFPLLSPGLAAKKFKQNQIMRFTRNLDTLLAAGLTLDHGLKSILKLATGLERQIIGSVIDEVKNGSPLSSALAKQPGSFSDFYLSIVKSGEASGDLGHAIHQLTIHLEKRQALRESILKAMLYPLILMVITLASLLFLLGFVIPRFASLFDGSAAPLPLISQIVFSVSAGFRDHWMLLLISIPILGWLLRQVARKNPEYFNKLILSTPLMGKLVQANIAAGFSRMMYTLLNSGLPLVHALNLTRDGISNPFFRNELNAAIEQVKAGEKISGFLSSSKVFPELGSELVSIGEETGNLSPMFLKAADIYEKESDLLINKALVILEPVLIIGLGVLIGMIILSVLLAMLSVNDLVI